VLAAVEKYLKSQIQDADVAIDTLYLVRLDTLTDKSNAVFTHQKLLSQLAALQAEADRLQQIYRLSAEKAGLNRKLFGNGHILTKSALGEAEDAKNKALGNIEKMQGLLATTDSINKLIESSHFDSTRLIGYKPIFVISALQVSSGVVIKPDTLTVRLDDKFHVLEF